MSFSGSVFSALVLRTPLLGLGLLIVLLSVLRPCLKCIRALQVTMVGFGIAGLVGMYMHFSGNQEFALERDLQGGELFWESVTGVPPVLGPGAMVYMGLLGFAYTFRHPLVCPT